MSQLIDEPVLTWGCRMIWSNKFSGSLILILEIIAYIYGMGARYSALAHLHTMQCETADTKDVSPERQNCQDVHIKKYTHDPLVIDMIPQTLWEVKDYPAADSIHSMGRWGSSKDGKESPSESSNKTGPDNEHMKLLQSRQRLFERTVPHVARNSAFQLRLSPLLFAAVWRYFNRVISTTYSHPKNPRGLGSVTKPPNASSWVGCKPTVQHRAKARSKYSKLGIEAPHNGSKTQQWSRSHCSTWSYV